MKSNTMQWPIARLCLTSLIAVWVFGVNAPAFCFDPIDPPHEDMVIIEFARHIKPLIERHCLGCHGPSKQDGDFRIDRRDQVIPTYVVPGNAFESEWFDRITSTDPDWVMPPESEGGRMPVSDLALFRVWIDEGASWPEDITIGESVLLLPPERPGFFQSLWQAAGVLHPLTVHFPIALLVLGAIFALLGMRTESLFGDMAFYCLWIAAITSVVASISGWPFAGWKGRGELTSAEFGSTMFWHGWLGIAVTVLALILAVMATASRMKVPYERGVVWKLGMVFLAVLVCIVGYQGGKLTHGGMYTEAFRRLGFTVPGETESPVESSQQGESEVSGPDS